MKIKIQRKYMVNRRVESRSRLRAKLILKQAEEQIDGFREALKLFDPDDLAELMFDQIQKAARGASDRRSLLKKKKAKAEKLAKERRERGGLTDDNKVIQLR